MNTHTLLLIDVGNSRIKYWFDHAKNPLLADSEVPAVAHDSNASVATLRPIWQNESEAHGVPSEIRISHVARPELFEQICSLCAELWPNAIIRRLHTQAHHPRLELGYDHRQMGSDRYAQILGAQAIADDHDHIVIGAGTALTLDGVFAGGQHIGGVITAGVNLMRKALHQYTAQLPLEGGNFCTENAPQKTTDAIATGVMLSTLGSIDQFVQRYFQKRTPELLFCGGDAQLLINACLETPNLAHLTLRYTPALCLLGLLQWDEKPI